MLIQKALEKYGIINFTLVIAEFTDKISLLKCEQKWIDELKPSYNIHTIAGNSLGYKHTAESKDKLRTLALGLNIRKRLNKKCVKLGLAVRLLFLALPLK